MKRIYILLAVIFLSPLASHVFAANGDTIHVVTHQNVVMTTDPGGSGSNENKQWAVFPSAGTSYRKVFVVMSYKCPDGMSCGEWDYIDAVYLRRTGGVNGADKNIELIRFITPYGLQFGSSWSFVWHSDITDFAMFLHDSVEIGYVHTGYETSNGRGWDVTLDFNLVEGPWTMEPVAITPLWNGSFPFGNNANPIENSLTPVTHAFIDNTNVARVRIHHTGHGFDQTDGCSEFCDRYRQLKWDGTVTNQIQLWRKCGFNELFPQGGTWVYDRGNWCPGALVYPYAKDFEVQPSSSHIVDIDMEPFSDATPSGNEYIRSYLIEYKSPTLSNDIRIDDIFRPSQMPEYNRINPICDNPIISVTNVGNNMVTSMQINSAYIGQTPYAYNWTGSLSPGQSDTIELATTFMAPTSSGQLFEANVVSVNGGADAYALDNVAHAHGNAVPVTDNKIYLELKTNNEPEETGFTLTDTWGSVIYSRAPGTLSANTVYKDTFDLPVNACYRLVILDNDPYGGDGLSFWANTAGGSGYARLRKVNTVGIIKNFPADFGSRIEYNFVVGEVHTAVDDLPEAFEINVSPNPTADRAVIDFISPSLGDWNVDVFDVLGQRVWQREVKNSYGEMTEADMRHQPVGFYIVRVTQGNASVTRRLVVAR